MALRATLLAFLVAAAAVPLFGGADGAITKQDTEVKFTAGDGAADDSFGWSVAVSGDNVLVGAPLDDNPNGEDAGSVYLYRPESAGSWTETKIVASDGDADDHFGASVAIRNETLLVGANLDDAAAFNSGSAYLYEPDGQGGFTETKIVASDGDKQDRFGSSLDIDGSDFFVGAPLDDNTNGDAAGAAYLYEPDGQGGFTETKFIASDGAGTDFFGDSVSISGGDLLAGATFDDDNGEDSGSAYLYEPDGQGGYTETKILASDGEADDWFGESVALDGDTLLVGAKEDDNVNGNGAGAAYVYEPDGQGGYTETKILASDGDGGDSFGDGVAAEGDNLYVGAPDADSNVGATYLYRPDVGGGFNETKVTDGNRDGSDLFGASVDLSGEHLLAGARWDDDEGTDAGAAYLFVAPPMNVSASPGPEVDSMRVDWDAPSPASDGLVYHVKRSNTTGGPYTEIATTTDLQHTDTGLENQTYHYVITAESDEGVESYPSQEDASKPKAPPPPENASASPGPEVDSITVDWDAPSGTTQSFTYHVKRSTSSGGPYTEIATTTDLQHTDTGLDNQTYHYVITAESDGGMISDPSNEASSEPKAPPPPANLDAVPGAGEGEVSLDWDAPSGTTQSFTYHVKRSTSSGGPYTEIATTTDLQHTDTGLDNQTYHYVVTAESDGGLISDPSDEASARPPTPPPENLAASEGDEGGEVDLDWDEPAGADDPLTYRVYRSTESGDPYEFVDETSETRYTDGDLDPDTYYYVVTAVDDRGIESPHSREASAEPAPQALDPSSTDPGDESQNDAGTGGDASDDASDPTILSGGSQIPVDGAVYPATDPVDAYGTRISPDQTRSMAFTFATPAGQRLTVSLYDPSGNLVDRDTAVQGNPATVGASSGSGEYLASGTWVTVLEWEGPGLAFPALGGPAFSYASPTGTLETPAPTSGTTPGSTGVSPVVDLNLPLDYDGERRCRPNC